MAQPGGVGGAVVAGDLMSPRRGSGTGDDEMERLHRELPACAKEALVELLLDHAQDDDHLRRHLVLKVAAASSRHLGIQTYRG